jgi:hypothetical protein
MFMGPYLLKLWTRDELLIVENAIKQHICRVLKRKVSRSLGSYHQWVTDAEHGLLSNKEARILEDEDVQLIKGLAGTSRVLREEFPGYELSDVVHGSRVSVAREEIYFRVVRPGKSSDVGRAHADAWYHKEYGSHNSSRPSLKIWAPIVIDSQRSGLEFLASSCSGLADYGVLETSQGPRPYLPNEGDYTFELQRCEPGQALAFDDQVLHRGAVNRGVITRVSVEITLVPRVSR